MLNKIPSQVLRQAPSQLPSQKVVFQMLSIQKPFYSDLYLKAENHDDEYEEQGDTYNGYR